MTSTDSTTDRTDVPTTTTAAKPHPCEPGLHRNFGWLVGNYGEELYSAAAFGMWHDMIDPSEAPAHTARSAAGRAVLRDWLNEHGVIAAYEVDQIRTSVPLRCPKWCAVEHDEGDHLVRRGTGGVQHAAPIVNEDGISVDLLWFQKVEGEEEPLQVGAGGPSTDYEHFTNPDDMRRYAKALLLGADRLEAVRAGVQR